LFQPQTYTIALSLMLVSMLCWGSWANTVKLCPGYRFQLFYWDYVVGVLLGSLLWGLTLGSVGESGKAFLTAIAHTDAHHALLAGAGGVVFNIANLLLVAAIDIAGLAVAFPVGIGLALIVGSLMSYAVTPQGNPWLLFGGIALVLAAIVVDALAYRLREQTRAAMSRRGVVLCIVSGLLMGTFFPLVADSMTGAGSPGPYAAGFFFAIGVAVCAVPVNWIFMRKPLDGREPVGFGGYLRARGGWHVWGIVGGALWCTGAVMNFVASQAHLVGPAVSYSIGQGATMVSAAWGVFVWKEFGGAPQAAKRLLVWMFLLFVAGLTAVAIAPIV
jgi:glucose uptake protein